MTLEDKIKYWDKIEQDIAKLKEIQSEVLNGMMPYPIGSVILCKSKHHNSRPCKVLKYYLTKNQFTWKIKIVARCIDDAGNEIGDPTVWHENNDSRLQEVVDLLNEIVFLGDIKDTSMIFNG